MRKTTVLRNEAKFRVEYLGGHSLYPNEVQGTLYVTSDYVRFKPSKFTGRKVEFGFPMEKLKQARIRSTKRINWAKPYWFGLLALIFRNLREKYVQIIYEEKYGTLQIVDFDFLDD